MMIIRGLLVLLMLLGASAVPVWGATHHAGPNDYRKQLQRLKAGDTLLLKSGIYHEGLPLHSLVGQAGHPVVIEAENPADPPLFFAYPRRNTISIVDSAHVVIRNLILEGRGLRVDGVKAEGHAHWTHHITLEGLTIRGHGANQQVVGISTKTPSWNWVVRGNTIIGAGTGMYFGDSDGSDPFIAGLIENNLVINTRGYNIQVKHQQSRPELDGMPTERSETVIRNNVFSKAKGSGKPELARPNLLVGHWPLKGVGRHDRYLIYGNLFYQNPHEALFQGEGNFALYNNLFINHYDDAVHIQPHNDVPRHLRVFYNTVITPARGIVVRQAENELRAFQQPVFANLVFAADPIQAQQAKANISASLKQAPRYLAAPLGPLGRLDLTPIDLERLTLVFDSALLENLPDAELDFAGQPRRTPVAGAYATVGPVDWVPRLEIKPGRAASTL